MTLEENRKRLLYQSLHRGMKEADLLIGGFARAHLNSFNEEDLTIYETLLNQLDVDILLWLYGHKDIPADLNTSIFQRMHHYTFHEYTP